MKNIKTFKLIAASFWVPPYPGLVTMSFDREWTVTLLDSEKSSGSLDPTQEELQRHGDIKCPTSFFSQKKRVSNNSNAVITSIAGGSVSCIIGDNGTGKSTVLRWLARVLCGSVNGHLPSACLIWQDESGLLSWHHPLWKMRVEGNIKKAKEPPNCTVFFLDQSNHILAPPLLGFNNSEPYHNLVECSVLPTIDRDSSVAAIPQPVDRFSDGGSSVNLRDALQFLRFKEVLRQASVLPELQRQDLKNTILKQALVPIKYLSIRPRKVESVIKSVKPHIEEDKSFHFKKNDGEIDLIDYLIQITQSNENENTRDIWWSTSFIHILANDIKIFPRSAWSRSVLEEFSANITPSSEWFRDQLRLRKRSNILVNVIDQLVDKIQDDGWSRLQIDIKDSQIDSLISLIQQDIDLSFMEATWMSADGQPVHLSSGERAAWSMIARISYEYRKVDEQKLNPHVLILDEPETSLHAEWQKQVIHGLDIALLATGCPMSATIIATHSPLILSCLPSDSINRLTRLPTPHKYPYYVQAETFYEISTLGSTPDQMLTTVFGLEDPLIGWQAMDWLIKIVNQLDAVERNYFVETSASDLQSKKVAFEQVLTDFESQADTPGDPILRSMLHEKISLLRQRINYSVRR